MNTRYIVLLSYSDGSGVIQAFGPYDSEQLAQDAMAEIRAWPALACVGRWDVLPCTHLAAAA